MKNCILIGCFLIACITSCKQNNDTNSLVIFPPVKEGAVPDSMIQFINRYIEENNYIVILYIDSAGCTPCSLQPIAYWKFRQNEMDKFGINILLIIQNSDHNMIKSLLDGLGMSYPVVFDDHGEFKQRNKFSDNTIIINQDKRVIWMGSPVEDYREWGDFIEMMELLEMKKKTKNGAGDSGG